MKRRIILWGGGSTDLINDIAKPVLGDGTETPWGWFPIWDYPTPPPELKPNDVLIAMGKTAITQLSAEKTWAGMPKNAGVEKLRSRVGAFREAHAMVTYDPVMANIDAAARPQIRWDLRLARRFIATGSVDPVLGQYRWTTLDQFIGLIKDFIARKCVVTLDLETMGFYPYYPDKRIITWQITDREGAGFVLHHSAIPAGQRQRLVDALQLLLNDPDVRLRGANLKFDLNWLFVKDGITCSNFSFDTMLVGSMLDENRSNSLEWHAKEHTDLGGYDCVGLDTKVLMADLSWRRADEVQPGDELVGFDEKPKAGNGTRRMRTATAQVTKIITKPCIRITVDTGESVVCSEDHLWIARPRSVETGAWAWRTTRDLRLGTQLRRAAPGIAQGTDFEHGWMSGFLDGEGYTSKGGHVTPEGDKGFQLGWSQKQGAVFNQARNIAEGWGLKCSLGGQHGGTNDDVATVKLNQWDSMCALVRTRPLRLIAKRAWDGAGLPVTDAVSRIVKLEWLGEQEVVALKTSTATFVAEGLCSHNSAFNQKYDKGRMDLVPIGTELLTYAAGDVDSCRRVSEIQIRQLRAQPSLARLYSEVVHPAARAFEKIEQRGVLVDPERYAALRADLEKDIAHSHAQALKFLPPRLKAKHAGKLDLSRGDLVGEYLFGGEGFGLGLKPKMFTAVKGEPSTAAKHLKMFMDDPEGDAVPFITEYRKYVSSSKIMGTYVDGFLKHLRPDNRFHATYLLFNGSAYESDDDDSGTVTGRLTALDPAMQTVPKHKKLGQSKYWAKELRKCFIAPPGMMMWEADFSQGELRVVACVANEQAMLNAYMKNMDLHCLSGANMAKVQYDDFVSYSAFEDTTDPAKAILFTLYKEFRQKAKSANFGLLYGMGAEGFQAYARDAYGVIITLAEAEEIHATFFKTYPGLLDYHNYSKKFAENRGFVQSPLGRVRTLPLIRSPDRYTASTARRQAINSPIQGCLSDLCLFAIVHIEMQLAAKGVQLIGMIHDAIIGYVPEDNAEELCFEIQGIMSNLPIKEKLGWDHQLTFPADIEYGADWASLKKLTVS